ncbi:MAG TPA: beta-L-arabinofuranosidase domain-containing protein [Opitutaceae bacterium]
MDEEYHPWLFSPSFEGETACQSTFPNTMYSANNLTIERRKLPPVASAGRVARQGRWRLALGLCLLPAVTASAAIEFPSTRLKASDPATWKPVSFAARVPTGGVTLSAHGLFQPVLQNNIEYLLSSFSVDHMLAPFRQRAGQLNPPDDQPQVPFWDTELRGSNAGRFMMGAGNTLRWINDPELRRRLDQLIDGIESCREPNGYILAFNPRFPRSEEPNYGRAWFTHGLIESGIAGNPKAFGLLRGHADWFNQWDLLPELLYFQKNSHQGHIASTRTYFSPVGKPADLQVAEKYYLADWWIDGLAARNPESIWKYPLQNPHSYLITSFEAYLDHYLATGEGKLLEACQGAWEMIHDNWEHVGGSMAICESHWHMIDGKYRLPENPGNADLSHGQSHPPKSYFLSRRGHTGETCGTVFWIKFNQRFQQLYPDQEKFTAEIEKSIYNVLLANQQSGKNIRYHAALQGRKENGNRNRPPPAPHNTCCEGQGTRAFGSLPEYIYSLARDGLYVNLFEGSTISWTHDGEAISVEQITQFPFDPRVSLLIRPARETSATIHVRVPSWAAGEMPILVNGEMVASGKPGTFVPVTRRWRPNDRVDFILPMGFRVTKYEGLEQIKGYSRYAIEYGPILMAVTGELNPESSVVIGHAPGKIADWLKPVAKRPLVFSIEGDPTHEVMPYWLIDAESFVVFSQFKP